MEVENERDLLQQADWVASLSKCFTWLQQCDECIERIEERSRAKLPRLSIGNRQSLVARIARLEGVKIQLQRRFLYILAMIIRVQAVVMRRDLFGERSIPRSKVV